MDLPFTETERTEGRVGIGGSWSCLCDTKEEGLSRQLDI